MSAPPYVKPGCSRRLELHQAKFACDTYHLKAAEIGELFEMLMAEVGQQPVPSSTNRFVTEAFARRRAYSRIKGSFGRESIPPAMRRAVLERDGHRCRYCGSEVAGANYHCDHVRPVANGGRTVMQNLAAACRPCNLSKGVKPLDKWIVR